MFASLLRKCRPRKAHHDHVGIFVNIDGRPYAALKIKLTNSVIQKVKETAR